MRGRVLTRSFEFETRQYKLGPLDVVGGVPRSMITIGAPLTIVWFALLTAVFGLPDRVSIMLYVTLPVSIVVYGFEDDPARERRKKITTWVRRARYALVGHRPITAGRRAGRVLGWRDRAGWRGLAHAEEGVWATRRDAGEGIDAPGRVIRLDQGARLIGFDAMSALRDKKNGRGSCVR